MRVQFVFGEVWVGLRRNLTMTAALVVVVAISLSLLGTGLLFVKQVDHTRSLWQGRLGISVYLCSSTSPDQQCTTNGAVTQAEIAQIGGALHRMPQVTAVSFQTQQDAYQQARQLFANQPMMLNFVQPGDLPSSFEVRLRNAETDAAAVAAAVNGMPGVDTVGNDSAVLDKFYKLLDGVRNAVIVVAIILIVAAVLLVANTIRLSAFNRRRETAIMRLVGASNFYVQLPFLAEGVIAGLFGWLISAALLAGARSGLNGLQQYFPIPIQLSTLDLVEVVLITMLIGLVLCGTTSFLTLRRYLRV